MFIRWLPTFLSFPLGGLIVLWVVGSIDSPLAAAVGGALAGAVIGSAQWLVLHSRGIGLGCAPLASIGMAAGSAVAATLTGTGTAVHQLIVSGLVAGTFVGAAQATTLRRGRRVSVMWPVVVGVAWSLGWLTTSAVGVDVERGYIVFGASGALVATVLTGLALRAILEPMTKRARPRRLSLRPPEPTLEHRHRGRSLVGDPSYGLQR